MAGITYFKLMNPKYGDDKTKGCALTGAEVDANFNFLRGYDIEKIAIVDQTNLEFKRVNGEIISVDLMDEEVRENVEQLNNEVDDIQRTISEIELPSVSFVASPIQPLNTLYLSVSSFRFCSKACLSLSKSRTLCSRSAILPS